MQIDILQNRLEIKNNLGSDPTTILVRACTQKTQASRNCCISVCGSKSLAHMVIMNKVPQPYQGHFSSPKSCWATLVLQFFRIVQIDPNTSIRLLNLTSVKSVFDLTSKYFFHNTSSASVNTKRLSQQERRKGGRQQIEIIT